MNTQAHILTLVLAVATGFAMASGAADAPQPKPSAPASSQVRIGLYDSRAVAVAYCDTPMHRAEIKQLDDALKRARTVGNADEIKRCDTAVWDARKRLHRQGFSTYPVEDILGQITNEVARIKAGAQVVALISKWDEPGLKKYRKADRVDVTEPLVDALHPNDRQRKLALEIQKHKPVSAKELEAHFKQEGH